MEEKIILSEILGLSEDIDMLIENIIVEEERINKLWEN